MSTKWTEIAETKLVKARGKLAVRNLKVLLSNIEAIEKRVKCYLAGVDSNAAENKLFVTYLEEIVEKCNALEEQTVNSIENWTDIIPEADITTQIGLISQLKVVISQLTNDIDQMKQSAQEIKEESSRVKEGLNKKISEKEKELAAVRSKLREKEIEFFPTSIASTGIGLSGIGVYGLLRNARCEKCGKEGIDDRALRFGAWICPDCKKKGA
jgi:outer membrane murein-binding lipoprotein Lpp